MSFVWRASAHALATQMSHTPRSVRKSAFSAFSAFSPGGAELQNAEKPTDRPGLILTGIRHDGFQPFLIPEPGTLLIF